VNLAGVITRVNQKNKIAFAIRTGVHPSTGSRGVSPAQTGDSPIVRRSSRAPDEGCP